MAEIRAFEKFLRHLSNRYPSVPGWSLSVDHPKWPVPCSIGSKGVLYRSKIPSVGEMSVNRGALSWAMTHNTDNNCLPHQQQQEQQTNTHQKPPSPMSNSAWNIGEVIALSLGVVLIFALCFGFRIWWGRRRDKRRKQQERDGVDVEAAPHGETAHDARSEGRYDRPTVVELVPVDSNDGGQSHERKGGDSGGQQGGGHSGGHVGGEHGESGHGNGGGGGGDGNGGAGGTS
ncbi:hypothetical protein QR685DRAFT_575143 [Neurospora intermedia]|uniref:Uncharacterized protein n=1 Tax=Neurospora intermedia TaxID=5142 RepID=A0ABR3D467_NEUIN